jgi:hypothetical protein
MKIPREELRQAEAACNRLANEGEGNDFMSLVRALEEKYGAKVKVTLTPHRVGEHPKAPGGIHIHLEEMVEVS